MYYFQKEKTFLKQFDENTKIGYDRVGRIKVLYWFIIYLISTAVQIIPIIIVMIAIGLVLRTLYVGPGVGFNLYGIWVEWFELAVTTGITILSFFLYIRFVERRPFYTIGLKSSPAVKKYLKGAGIAMAMQLTYFIIVMIFGWAELVDRPIHATAGFGASALGWVLLFLVGFIIQGASEEVVVRGWMLPVLARHYRVGTAIVLSSVYFGFLHIFNPNVGTLPIINLILYGVFTSLYALYDDGLWGIFGNHSIWNWFMGNVLGMPVSGAIFGKVSIIETKLTGPAWITGGAFGPEGGVIETLILLVSIGILIRLLMKKEIIVKEMKY